MVIVFMSAFTALSVGIFLIGVAAVREAFKP